MMETNLQYHYTNQENNNLSFQLVWTEVSSDFPISGHLVNTTWPSDPGCMMMYDEIKNKQSPIPTALSIPLKSQLDPKNCKKSLLDKIQKVIEENMADEKFSVAHLCKILAMSRMQLHRKLKSYTNDSAGRLIRRLRLAKAIKLLQRDQLTIAEVAFQVGFKYPNYFTRVFVKEFGVKPSDLRRT